MSSRDHPDWWRPTGGQNSQDSILERRSLIWNDDGVLDGVAPFAFYPCSTYIGKFFTRGCRGMIEQLQVYCQGDGVDELVLRYSPHPCIGPFGEVTIVPAVGWAWQGVDVEEMWNYDSLFIWVYACGGNVEWGVDGGLPFDGHISEDGGATWEDTATRPFFRAVYTGETPGDVPVSGIVNTIRIPNTGFEAAAGGVLNVPNNVMTDIVTAEGTGQLIQVQALFQTIVVPAAAVEYTVVIEADGAPGTYVSNRQLTQSVVATFGRCAIGEFLQTAAVTLLWVRLPIDYRRNLLVRVWQTTGAPCNVNVVITANELR